MSYTKACPWPGHSRTVGAQYLSFWDSSQTRSGLGEVWGHRASHPCKPECKVMKLRHFAYKSALIWKKAQYISLWVSNGPSASLGAHSRRKSPNVLAQQINFKAIVYIAFQLSLCRCRLRKPDPGPSVPYVRHHLAILSAQVRWIYSFLKDGFGKPKSSCTLSSMIPLSLGNLHIISESSENSGIFHDDPETTKLHLGAIQAIFWPQI